MKNDLILSLQGELDTIGCGRMLQEVVARMVERGETPADRKRRYGYAFDGHPIIDIVCEYLGWDKKVIVNRIMKNNFEG